MNNIKLKIGDTQYIIKPELTLGEYMKLQKVEKSKLDTRKILEIITGIPTKELDKMDLKTSNYVVNKILNVKMAPPESKVYSTFEFKGVLYGLETDLTKLNFGGWVDLEMFISMGFSEHLNKIVSIFYRPILAQVGKKYVLKEYDTDEMLKRSEEFYDLPFKYVVGSSTFFLKFTEVYTRDTLHTLKQRNKKARKRMRALNYMRRILPSWLLTKLPPDFTKLN